VEGTCEGQLRTVKRKNKPHRREKKKKEAKSKKKLRPSQGSWGPVGIGKCMKPRGKKLVNQEGKPHKKMTRLEPPLGKRRVGKPKAKQSGLEDG